MVRIPINFEKYYGTIKPYYFFKYRIVHYEVHEKPAHIVGKGGLMGNATRTTKREI
jgi:hypothetical protein